MPQPSQGYPGHGWCFLLFLHTSVAAADTLWPHSWWLHGPQHHSQTLKSVCCGPAGSHLEGISVPGFRSWWGLLLGSLALPNVVTKESCMRRSCASARARNAACAGHGVGCTGWKPGRQPPGASFGLNSVSWISLNSCKKRASFQEKVSSRKWILCKWPQKSPEGKN